MTVECTRVSLSNVAPRDKTGKDTHCLRFYQDAFHWVLSQIPNQFGEPVTIIDPFARNCPWAHPLTNDINTDTHAQFNMDAYDFLKFLNEERGYHNDVDLCLWDPPFSSRQSVEKYNETANVYTVPGYVKDCMNQISLLLKPGGWLLKLGYNTSQHHPCFDLKQAWVVNSGGNRNDILVTAWQYNQHTLCT